MQWLSRKRNLLVMTFVGVQRCSWGISIDDAAVQKPCKILYERLLQLR